MKSLLHFIVHTPQSTVFFCFLTLGIQARNHSKILPIAVCHNYNNTAGNFSSNKNIFVVNKNFKTSTDWLLVTAIQNNVACLQNSTDKILMDSPPNYFFAHQSSVEGKKRLNQSPQGVNLIAYVLSIIILTINALQKYHIFLHTHVHSTTWHTV